MKCLYCQGEVQQVGQGSDNFTHMLHVKCENCHVGFSYATDPMEVPILCRQSFYSISIKEKSYKVVYDYSSPAKTIIQFFKINQEINQVKTGEWALIHILPFIADWTPQNAKEKLERLLVFM